MSIFVEEIRKSTTHVGGGPLSYLPEQLIFPPTDVRLPQMKKKLTSSTVSFGLSASTTDSGTANGRDGSRGRKGRGGGGGRRRSFALTTACLVLLLSTRSAAFETCDVSCCSHIGLFVEGLGWGCLTGQGVFVGWCIRAALGGALICRARTWSAAFEARLIGWGLGRTWRWSWGWNWSWSWSESENSG